MLFANNGDQQKAIAAMDGKQIEGRAIAVKAAMTEFAAEKARSDAQAARAPAAGATSAPAAAAAPAATSAPVAAAAPAAVAAPAAAAAKKDVFK